MKRTSILLAVCVLVVTVLAPWAYAQAPAQKPAVPDSEKWEFGIVPYFWGTQIDSRVTVKGYDATSTTYFSDIWDNLDGAFLVHMEAMKGGKWGFFVDAIYLKVQDEGEFKRARALRPDPPTRELTFTTESWIVEFGGMYRLGKWPMEGKPGQAVTLDGLVGGRYWDMSMDLDTSTRIHPSGSDQWVDPFIGAQVKVDITKQLSFILRGDIGGFGVGSQISYNGFALFGYSFTPNFTALLGYRALYIDYKKSSSDFRAKETFQGPIAGLAIIF